MRKLLPCRECITLAICREEFKSRCAHTDPLFTKSLKAREYLQDKCPLLSSYLDKPYYAPALIKKHIYYLEEFMLRNN